MQLRVRQNTIDPSMGEITISYMNSKTVIDYSERDDIAHELINAYKDLFDAYGDNGWQKHLGQYLDKDDVEEMNIL